MIMPRPWWRAMIGKRDVASCLHVARVLQSYLDGQIDDVTARRVSRHLEICRRCGLEASIYNEIKTALSRHDQTPPAESLRHLEEFASRLIEHPPEEPIDTSSGA